MSSENDECYTYKIPNTFTYWCKTYSTVVISIIIANHTLRIYDKRVK